MHFIIVSYELVKTSQNDKTGKGSYPIKTLKMKEKEKRPAAVNRLTLIFFL